MASKIIQIWYEESQLKHLYPFATPYFNDTLTIHFENSVICEHVLATDAEKIAVCSWRLREKMRWQKKRPRELTQDILNEDYQVLSFTNNSHDHQMLEFGDIHHVGLKETFLKMLGLVGISCPLFIKNPIYQNAFSARTDLYREYVTTYLKPCMEAIENDPELNKMAMRDSRYKTLTQRDGEFLVPKIGINYWPLVPFVLERLFSVYVQNKKLNVELL